MEKYTAILDYGVGNLRSVTNAMDYLGIATRITSDAAQLERAHAIILPGVGAFPDAAEKLRSMGLDTVLQAQSAKKPLLGICLGMQLLLTQGEEVCLCNGLDLIAGRVQRIETEEKLPHIGWNTLSFPHASPLFRGLDEGASVYFVHSYCAQTAQEEDVIAYTQHGSCVVAAVQRGNVFGCQFHPEKSGEVGLQILRNFAEVDA